MRLLLTGDPTRRERFADLLRGRGHNAHALPGGATDADSAARACQDADALLHIAPIETDSANGGALDTALRELYLFLSAALDAGVRRFGIISTLRLFSRVPRNYRINEQWRPYPTTAPEDLLPFLSELSVREMARVSGDGRALCLRLGDALTENATADALTDALTLWDSDDYRPRSYMVLHRGDSARAAADARPWREALISPPPIPARPIRHVVIFGAGGPVGRALTDELRDDYILRLTDIRPLAEIASENRPQSPFAPVARPLPPPHENRVVDVRDPVAVRDACVGMDAIINLSVVREDIAGAFGVNLLGAYNVMAAAVAHDIRRVVHTGPQLLTVSRETGYHYEHPVSGDAPARPGRWVYTHSKYLAQEVVRIFTERYGLSVPCLLFNNFVSADAPYWGDQSFIVTWEDSARALRAALETPDFPSPFETMHICADLPQGGVSPHRAYELLGWRPQDDMSRAYKKPPI